VKAAAGLIVHGAAGTNFEITRIRATMPDVRIATLVDETFPDATIQSARAFLQIAQP